MIAATMLPRLMLTVLMVGAVSAPAVAQDFKIEPIRRNEKGQPIVFEVTSRISEPFTVFTATGNHRFDCMLWPQRTTDERVLLIPMDSNYSNAVSSEVRPGDRFIVDFSTTPCGKAVTELFYWEVDVIGDLASGTLSWTLE